MTTKGSISIWFFIGALLLIYGILITSAGIYGLFHPPQVRLAHLHVGIWWGVLMIVLGAAYSYVFFPKKQRDE